MSKMTVLFALIVFVLGGLAGPVQLATQAQAHPPRMRRIIPAATSVTAAVQPSPLVTSLKRKRTGP